MPKPIYQNTKLEISSVEEKIKVEKQLPFDPKSKIGPTIDLYFHELPAEQNSFQNLFQLFFGFVLMLVFLLTLPLIASYIKLVSRRSVFIKKSCTGQRGRVFELLTYRIQNHSSEFYPGSKFLKYTGLYKLPAIINVWKGNLNLFGPNVYPASWCNQWNEEFSDFYKRFALAPGMIGITSEVENPNNTEAVAEMLSHEFRYIVNPTLSKDLKNFFGINQ